jgi:hypothetical protein
MDTTTVDSLAAEISAKLAGAKERLLSRMHELGLLAAHGWRVTEEIRHTIHGTEWVFRPVHIREQAPDIQELVLIDSGGRPH